MTQLMQPDLDADALSQASSSSSSLSVHSLGPVFVAEFRNQECTTPRSQRSPMHSYNIHTYLPHENRSAWFPAVSKQREPIIDKVYAFSLDRRVDPGTYDIYFRGVYATHPSVYNPNRISNYFRGVNTKVAILKGPYEDQLGVIVKAYFRRLFHKVLVHDGNLIVIHQRDIKLLDPWKILPPGYPELGLR